MICAPLYIHSFRPAVPRKLLEAQQFNKQYHDYEEIHNVPDRLRWCRHHSGLLQQEVAHLVGISRHVYIGMETGTVNCYDKEAVNKLAALFQIPVDDLLDDYNRFLYYGQGRQLRQIRQALGVDRNSFAKLLNVNVSTIQKWETEKKRMSKKSWEKYLTPPTSKEGGLGAFDK